MKKTKKANGEGSIYSKKRNGRNYYTGQVTVGYDKDGKQIRKSVSGYNKKEVQAKMAEYKVLAHNGQIGQSKKICFQDFFIMWANEFKRPNVLSNTYEMYEMDYRLRIKDTPLGKMDISKIKAHHLQAFCNDMLNNHSVHCSGRCLTRIKSCLTFAFDENYINFNPTKNVKIEEKSTEKKKPKVYSREEQEKLINHLTLFYVDMLIYFCFATGLRLGEALALEWDDINNNIVQVNKQYKRISFTDKDGNKCNEYKIGPLKTKTSFRSVPIPEKAMIKLKEYKLQQLETKLYQGQKYNDKNIVFADEYGNYIVRTRPNKRLRRICEEINIPYLSIHSARHSYATRLFELGVDLKTIQGLLGHATITMTMDTYAHLLDAKKITETEKLNVLFN